MFRGRDPSLSPSAEGTVEFPDPFELLTIAAVREMLARPDADTFLEWMRREGPKNHPGVFADVPMPVLWPSFATNLGVGLWNAMPLPHHGFRPDPLPAQTASDPCRCGSGKTYAHCCSHFPSPSFPSESLWIVLVSELEEEDLIAAAASLRMPESLLLDLARHWQRSLLPKVGLKMLQPVFRKLPKILAAGPVSEYLEPLTIIFVDFLMETGSQAKESRWRKRLLAELPVELHYAVRVLAA